MSQTALIAKTIFTPDRISDGVVLFEDDRITAAGTREQVRVPSGAREIRIEKGFVAPGFIDTHNHGAGGRRPRSARHGLQGPGAIRNYLLLPNDGHCANRKHPPRGRVSRQLHR
jgi:imidazolonepropionase-like amidohydrolase